MKKSLGRAKLAIRRVEAFDKAKRDHGSVLGWYLTQRGPFVFNAADLSDNEQLREAYTQAVLLAEATGKNAVRH